MCDNHIFKIKTTENKESKKILINLLKYIKKDIKHNSKNISKRYRLKFVFYQQEENLYEIVFYNRVKLNIYYRSFNTCSLFQYIRKKILKKLTKHNLSFTEETKEDTTGPNKNYTDKINKKIIFSSEELKIIDNYVLFIDLFLSNRFHNIFFEIFFFYDTGYIDDNIKQDLKRMFLRFMTDKQCDLFFETIDNYYKYDVDKISEYNMKEKSDMKEIYEYYLNNIYDIKDYEEFNLIFQTKKGDIKLYSFLNYGVAYTGEPDYLKDFSFLN